MMAPRSPPPSWEQLPSTKHSLPSASTEWQLSISRNSGQYTLATGTTLTVVLNAGSANGTVVADAIEIIPFQATADGATLDYGTAFYSKTGTWTSHSGGFSGTYATATAGSAGTSTWTTSVSSADQGWQNATIVSATWTASASNATDATYTIWDGPAGTGTLLGTMTVNQTLAPVGTVDGSFEFQELGKYTLATGDTLTVVLSASSANGKVVADAIAVIPAAGTPGGPSAYEPEPSYQTPFQSTGQRTAPDVAFDGSPYSGVTVFLNDGSVGDINGTSLSCPC